MCGNVSGEIKNGSAKGSHTIVLLLVRMAVTLLLLPLINPACIAVATGVSSLIAVAVG